MSDMLSISSTAVSAYQRALTTVSNNIANVSTDGYSRQDVALEANMPAKSASYYLGTGVMFAAVKRQFDAFAESNLRKSTSDLQAQGPMVDYTKRVMDIMGDKSISLSSALDEFFNAARQLSVDPASTVERGSFLRSAGGVASRFSELSGQLDLISVECRQALESAAGQFNTLTDQLSLVNRQLSQGVRLEEQPSELLDRRDLLLRQISEFAGIKTSFESNGVVRVGLGATSNQSLVVDGQKARPIGVDTTNGKFGFVLDPYGTAEPLPSINSGTMGGLTNFLSKVLGPAQNALDLLAQSVVSEVNGIQLQGIDGYGDRGNKLFQLDATKEHASSGVSLLMNDPLRIATGSMFRVAEGNAYAGAARATIDYEFPAPGVGISNTHLVNNPNPSAGVPFKVDGVRLFQTVTAVAAGVDTPTFYLDNPADGQQLQVMTRDGRHVLGKSLTIDEKYQMLNPDNGFAVGSTYSDKYLNRSDDLGYRDMNVWYGVQSKVQYSQKFDKNGIPMTGAPIPAQLVSAPISNSLSGEILTEGAIRINGHAMGSLSIDPTSTDKASDIAAWLNNAQLSGVHAKAFNEITVDPASIDYKAPLVINNHVITGYTNLESLVQAIQRSANDTPGTPEIPATDDSPLIPATPDIAGTGVTARINERGQLVLENLPDSGGKSILLSTGSNDPKVTLTALGLAPQEVSGRIRIQRDLDLGNPDKSSLQIGFGDNGDPADLARLGFRTGAYIEGQVPDDMLVFVTGPGLSARVAASYSGEPVSVQDNLRGQTLTLKFLPDNFYSITDEATQTEVARRPYDPTAKTLTIQYQGLNVHLNTQPKVGDTFSVDGNRDGLGDNSNMLVMADLTRKPVINGKTLANTYVDEVNNVGNMAQQAKITQQALTVVNDQAVASRDKVSGVNLDDEAAQLIRFQQAYQASAKAMQVSNDLFSSILQVR